MAVWPAARVDATLELLSTRPTDVRQWQAKLGAKDKFVPVQDLVDLQLKQVQASAAAVAATCPPSMRVIGLSVVATPDGRIALDAIELAGTKT